MACSVDETVVRNIVFAVSAAQVSFWTYTLFLPREGATPIDLIILWLTAPAIFFGAHRGWTPLGAGLAVASLFISGALLI